MKTKFFQRLFQMEGGKSIEDILTQQPDVKSTWIIQISFCVCQYGQNKNLLEETVVQDVIGQGNFKTVLSYFRNKKKRPLERYCE